MNSTIKIATVQQDILWEDTQGNLEQLSKAIKQIQEKVDVIVLPEMFNTGFSMNPSKIALKYGGIAKDWMIKTAKEVDACLVGSIAIEEEGKFYNRLYWAYPDGEIQKYDKRHLFRMAEEHQVYTGGNATSIIEFKGFRFCLQVCYDLRFPVWSRRTKSNDYDCLLYVANWPAVRSDAWYSLLKARAIENLCYVIGVNRVGKDGNANVYDGKSVVFDFKGSSIDAHIVGEEGISIQTLHKQDLIDFRTKFPADLDADQFKLII
jgi:predicted amidohydrolase